MLKNPENLTRKELLDYINVILALLKKLQNSSKSEIEEITSKIENIELLKGDKGDEGIIGQDGSDGVNGYDGRDGKDGVNGTNGKDGKEGHTPIAGIDYEIPLDGKNGDIGADGADGSPDTPEEVRDKLKELKNDERLSISAIKDLREELDKIKTRGGSAIYGGGGGGGRIVKAYDISASLNGTLKVFSLPSMWRIISVQLSSIPNILRNTTDYVYDNSAHTITFTDEIKASSSLATGQTAIITYSE